MLELTGVQLVLLLESSTLFGIAVGNAMPQYSLLNFGGGEHTVPVSAFCGIAGTICALTALAIAL